MARAELIIPKIKKWEGGFVNDPNDAGGATMYGITLKTFRSFYGSSKTVEDLKKMTDYQWLTIFKRGYWDPMKCDMINNQSIAELVVDMAWMSGVVTTIKKVQGTLGLKADGIIGPKTLGKLNDKDSKTTFTKLWNMRKQWFIDISRKGANYRFLKGWLNRLNDFTYKA